MGRGGEGGRGVGRGGRVVGRWALCCTARRRKVGRGGEGGRGVGRGGEGGREVG